MFPNFHDFRPALSILFATGLCSRTVTQDPLGDSPQEYGGTKLKFEKMTLGRHNFFQSVCVYVFLCISACLSLVWEREEHPQPLFPRALARGYWGWHGTGVEQQVLTGHCHTSAWSPLPVIGLAYLYMYFYVYMYFYIYIHTHTNSCVCVHVYAYLHRHIARCGFTEKGKSSWPQWLCNFKYTYSEMEEITYG